MNQATKGTGAAALIATGIAVTVVWVLTLYNIKVPQEVSLAWQGLLTVAIGYFVHDREPSPPTTIGEPHV